MNSAIINARELLEERAAAFIAADTTLAVEAASAALADAARALVRAEQDAEPCVYWVTYRYFCEDGTDGWGQTFLTVPSPVRTEQGAVAISEALAKHIGGKPFILRCDRLEGE